MISIHRMPSPKRRVATPASRSACISWNALPFISGDVRPGIGANAFGRLASAADARVATPGTPAWSPPI